MKRATDQQLGLLRARARGEVSPESVAAVAEALFRATLYGDTGGLQWGSVALVAHDVLAALHEDVANWDLAAFARDVVRRHLGESVLLRWPEGLPWFDSLDTDDRLAVLAHVVQSAADADLESAGHHARRGEAVLAGTDRLDPALRLCGAIARALSATGDYKAAASRLEEAVDGWFALGRIDGASFALSELLRVRGISRDGRAIQHLGDRVRQFRVSVSDPVSLAFVRLANGRALVQAGALEQGAAELADGADQWAVAPVHAVAARWRWLHYAALQREDTRARDHLAALRGFGSSAQLPLARIDAALGRGEIIAPLVDELLSLIPEGAEAARTLARIAPGLSSTARAADRASVARMAWEYRY